MTTGALVVREANDSDLAQLVSLMREFYAEAAFPLTEPQAARSLLGLLRVPALGAVWLMEADGRPAGFIVLTVAFSMEYGGLRGFVDDLFVAPAFRRRGLASLALETVRRASVERGVRALLVETAAPNTAAVALYQRHGFCETGRQLMTLPLAAPVHEPEAVDDASRRT